MSNPFYQPIKKEEIPNIKKDNGKVVIYNFAGDFENTLGPGKILSQANILTIEIFEGGNAKVDIDPSKELVLYLLKGEVTVNKTKKASQKDMVWFESERGKVIIEAHMHTMILMMAGKPLNEPVVSSGPFVMNTVGELKQAYLDFQTGKMGQLVE